MDYNKTLNLYDLKSYFNMTNLNKNEYILLLGRLLFPTYYFDIYDDIINYYQKIVEYELENPGMDLSDDLTEEYRLIVKEYSRYNEEK